MNKNPLNTLAQALICTVSELIVIALLTGAVLTRADIVTFDNYTSPTDNDLVNLFNNRGTHTQTTSGGITGGAVQASGVPNTPMYKTSFNPLGGLTTSMFLKYDNVNSGPGASGFSGLVGFAGFENANLDVSLAYFSAQFINDGVLTIFSRGSGNGNGFNDVGTTLPPAFGSWLRLTFSERYLGASQFRLSATLENYGPTGMDAPTLLTSGSLTVINGDAAADTSVYAGFGGYYHVGTFDNFEVVPFEVVPEPGVFQTMALGGLLLALAKIKERTIKQHRK